MKWKAGNGQKINTMYAWVAEDEEGGEGICSWQVGGEWLPLVGADMERINLLRQFAKLVHERTNRPVRLVEWTTRSIREQL